MTMFATRKRITTAIAAAALALAGMTAAAVPARAGNDDLAKILLGVGTVFIISKALESNNERRSAGQAAIVGRDSHYYDKPNYGDRNDGRYHRRAPQVPAVCAIQIGRKGTTYYGARCLREEGFRARLPNRCETTMRTNRGARTVYDGTCLQRAGLELEGERRRRH